MALTVKLHGSLCYIYEQINPSYYFQLPRNGRKRTAAPVEKRHSTAVKAAIFSKAKEFSARCTEGCRFSSGVPLYVILM